MFYGTLCTSKLSSKFTEIEVILSISSQLPLPIDLPVHKTFDSFYIGSNALLVSAIHKAISGAALTNIYFWSAESAGRSHLLYAACHQLTEAGRQAAYVPLEEAVHFSVELLDGMENMDLICLDNLNVIAGNPVWEEAVFDLFNRVRERGHGVLLMTGNQSPKKLNITLPDLVSRLNWGQVYPILPLSDDEKISALQQRAALRGFELPQEVGQYLIHHLDRNIKVLFDALEKLAHDSMSAKRKLTIPFVKSSLSI